ncbi:hypothetical protein GCM10011575_28440 [Microlunatus endophyticus]|uniref:Aminoglycoside phosphotransferase domain-containing protein n=1 Tax=Microlunatus endophyticus TaxID=1716077 RepID=A0A917W4W7_9ACTN|nr:phosphotransferase [Microlunatus endophyticus]GGL68214.1 hypothetical protein GCM10011575_28440 [Microlunatus endophyticus]
MVSDRLSEDLAAEILRRDLGGDWQLSDALGTMEATRLAHQADRAVAIKLTETPATVMQRLSDLGVTPEIIALGQADGVAYLIQRAVTGPHPDHVWWLSHRARWADMITSYLNDSELAALVVAGPVFWRLDVPAARSLVERDLERSDRHCPELRSAEFEAAFRSWRDQAPHIPSWPMQPVHPDPHIHNYVISDGTPYLLDWDHIDLSDPVRDVGWQLWGGLPRLGNALFNDSRNDLDGAAFHVEGFIAAALQQGWLETRG